MAPRKGAAVEEPPLVSLRFNQPLSWRAGKAIATGELLKRLEALANELRDIDQEEVDKDSLSKVAKELAGQNLLGHKDKGVRAFTACCLVDVLKICAPDAPFTPTQLKDIFTLFITSILPALSDPSNTYNTQHKYVLQSLSDVKSIVLLMDLPNSEALSLHLFTTFFDIMSGSSKSSTGEQISKDVEYHMNQVLVVIVDEATNLPPAVVDVIVAQFLRASSPISKGKQDEDADDKQSTLLLKELPEAYNMAKTICDACPEKMARYISQYFNDVIMDASESSGPARSNGHKKTGDAAESEDEEGPTGPTEADLRELQKAHKLLRELWRACPAVLQNVIPQLEAELSADNVQLRLLATETLGDIISGIGAAGPPHPPVMDPAVYPPQRLSDVPTTSISTSILTTPLSPQSFAQTHHTSYQGFIGRKNDKSFVIRAGWTTSVGRILATSAGGIGLSREDEAVLVKGLGEKLNDSDERVRIAAIRAIGFFNLPDIMSKLAPYGGVGKAGSVLNSLSDRVRDRKHAVQVEGMTTLSKIWGVASGEIAANNEVVVTALGAIPTKIFDAYYANDKALNVLLEHVMFEQLLPLSYPPLKTKGNKSNGDSQANGDGALDVDKIRTERILLIARSLDAKSKKAFFALHARQSTFAKVTESFLQRCEEYNGGVTEGSAKEAKIKLDAVIKWLTDFMPDSQKAAADFLKYAKMHDRRSYQLIRFTMDPKSEFSTVYKAIKEFTKRMSSASGLLETMLPQLYRSALILYNKSHVPAVMEYSRNDNNGLGATAKEILKEISERNPETFKSQLKEICSLIEQHAPSARQSNDLGSVDTLKICAGFARTSPGEIPKDRKFNEALTKFALYGTPAKAAKYAVQILMAISDRKEMHATDLLTKSTKNWVYGKDHFVTKLATISQLSLLGVGITESISDAILDITTSQVLLQVRTPVSDTDKSWQPDSEIDEECQAKCWALKTLVNRLRGTVDPDSATEIAGPIYKLLNALIVKNGEIAQSKTTPKHHCSRLRLLAAQLMLKLCQRKIFDDLLKPVQFNRISFVAQDPLANVRRGFIEKLQKYLVKEKLSHRFYTIIFLTAFEPEIEFKNSIITWIRSRAKYFQSRKSTVFESVFARLLSLLAHHPDFNAEPEDLKDHARYIIHYLTTVANEDNLALIYKYAERVKQARDGINPTESDNLYVMSDLAQAVIRKWEEKKGWSMQTWPGKVGLPIGLFSALPSHEVAQEIAEKQYLPEGMEELIDSVVKSAEKKKKRKAEDDGVVKTKKAKVEKRKGVKPAKREKTSKPRTPAKTKKPKTFTSVESSADRRRSSRGTASKLYADRDSSEDEAEMLEGVAAWKYEDEGDESESSEDQEGEDDENMQDAPNASDVEVDAEPSVQSDEEVVDEPVEEVEEQEDEPEEEPNPEAAEEEPEEEPAEDEPAEDEPEREPTPPTRTRGRKVATPVTKSRTSTPKAKPKAKEKPLTTKPVVSAKKAAASTRPTRSTRATRANDVKESE